MYEDIWKFKGNGLFAPWIDHNLFPYIHATSLYNCIIIYHIAPYLTLTSLSLATFNEISWKLSLSSFFFRLFSSSLLVRTSFLLLHTLQPLFIYFFWDCIFISLHTKENLKSNHFFVLQKPRSSSLFIRAVSHYFKNQEKYIIL